MFSWGAVTSLLTSPVAASSALKAVPVRSYIANFWSTKTAFKGHPGTKGKHQFFGRSGKKRLNIRMPDVRHSDIKRIRNFGFRYRMSYPNGRVVLMNQILKNERYICEF